MPINRINANTVDLTNASHEEVLEYLGITDDDVDDEIVSVKKKKKKKKSPGDNGDDNNNSAAATAADRKASSAEQRAKDAAAELHKLTRELEERHGYGAILSKANQAQLTEAREKYERSQREAYRLRAEAKKLAKEAATAKSKSQQADAEIREIFFRRNHSASEEDFQRLLPQLRDDLLRQRTLDAAAPARDRWLGLSKW